MRYAATGVRCLATGMRDAASDVRCEAWGIRYAVRGVRHGVSGIRSCERSEIRSQEIEGKRNQKTEISDQGREIND